MLERLLIRHFANGALLLVDRALRVVLIDGQDLVHTGRDPAEIEGKRIHDLYPPEICDTIETYVGRAFTGEHVVYEGRLHGRRYFVQGVPVTVDGEIEYVALTTQEIGELLQSLGEDVTGDAAFEMATIGRALVSLDGRWLKVNPALCAMTGYDEAELLQMRFQDITHPDDLDADLEQLRQVLAGEIDGYRMEKRYFRRDGAILPVLLSVSLVRGADGEPARLLSQIQDWTNETQLRELERELAERHRVDSLYAVAGGVAHDFNNLLVGIGGHTSFALGQVQPGTPLHQHLKQIEHAARRMAELTDQMLAFSGKTWLSPTPLVLGEHARAVRGRLDPDVAFVWSIVDDTPPVHADGDQLARVTEALMRNAVEALDGAKGTVSVSTGSVQLTRAELDRLAIGRDAAPGRFAYLEIADTGRGMEEQVVARMFEPFFTTKFTGRGLGLASVEGLIRAHRGALAVESAPGRGTRVRVMLPAAA